MIFRQLFQESFTVGIVEPEVVERHWIANKIHLDKVRIEEFGTVEDLMGNSRRTEIDVLLVSLVSVSEIPEEKLEKIRAELPGTALILLDDFDDGRLSQLAAQANCQDVLLKPELSSGSLTRSVLFSLQRFRNNLESQRLREEAEMLAKSKADFASMVSHEILNPMTGILGYLNLVMRTELTTEQRSYLSTVKSSCKSLSALVKDLLSFTKLEQGGVKPQEQTFSPYKLFFDLERQLHGQNECPEVRVIAHCDPALPTLLRADSLKIRQIAFNLAQNALKFTRRGHVAVLLRKLHEDESGVRLRLAVEDSGIGIPSEKIGSILEPFTQARAEDSRIGHGLGLAIVVKLLDILGSKLNIQSVEGKGTIFWCDIRAEKDAVGGQLDTPLRGHKVVILDENTLAYRYVSETVRSLGGEVAVLHSTDWKSGQIDLVLMESGYPGRQDVLGKSEGRVGRRIIYGCDYEQSLDGVLNLEGSCPPHRLVEVLRATPKKVKAKPILEDICVGWALVVDDDVTCRNYLVSELTQMGLQVDSAERKEDALELARGQRYDLIALDGYLGDTTGPALYRRLRKEDLITDRTLVLIVTGDPDSWRRRVRESDIVKIVGKPLGRKELLKIMESNFGAVDHVRLERLRALGETAIHQLFDAFRKGLPSMLATIEESLAEGEPDSVYKAAHRLKGSAATLGLSEIERCAGGLESAARQPESWSGWSAKLTRAIDRLDIDALINGGESCAS